MTLLFQDVFKAYNHQGLLFRGPQENKQQCGNISLLLLPCEYNCRVFITYLGQLIIVSATKPTRW